MNTYVKGFLVFLAYNAVAKLVIKPIAVSMNSQALQSVVS